MERYRGLPARELIISTWRKASRVREEVHRQHVEALRSMTRQQRLSRALEMYEVGLKLAEMAVVREALLAVSGILDALKVGHCLIGGLAVSVHGIPRFSDDVDFLVSAGIKKFQDELRRMVEERGGSCRYIKAHRGDPLGDTLNNRLPGGVWRRNGLWPEA